MRIFTHKIFTHRKIIIIFLLAIFIPSLIAAYLSLSTFPKRREAVKKLLESNLWISGEAALKSIEEALLELEQKTLKSENFIRLIQSKKDGQANFSYPVFSEDTIGQLFLLDADFKIIIPETVSENAFGIQWEKEIQNSQFAQFFQRAEFFEFSQKNYTKAAELYKECTSYTNSNQYRVIAFEGLGRCLLSSEKYDEAEKVYNELSKNYGQFHNKAGHPYGIAAMFQLYEIAREKKEEENSLGILLNLYKQIRDGIWLLNQPSYDFYIAEIESMLNIKLIDGKFAEIQKSYANI
jgi:tetratricopeptide (TPR) repeat protein